METASASTPAARGERFGLFRFGQGGIVAHGNVPDLALDRRSGGFREFRAMAGQPDVFVIRQPRTVEHDGGVSPFQRISTCVTESP